MFNFFKHLSPRLMFKRSTSVFSYLTGPRRHFADTRKSDRNSSKQVVVAGQGTESEKRLRVRRARPSDIPRVLRFVRDNARTAWPCLVSTSQASPNCIVLCDYVARALSQGHSMLAEQHESKRGWLQIRGLALGLAMCPWDAALVERWARCVQCVRSRRLLHFTAHCMRVPGLHDKYRVHNILQVILIVPPGTPQDSDIVLVLAQNAIQRGREVGFPLLRFDVTNQQVATALETLQLNKEWHLAYDILPEKLSPAQEETAKQKEQEKQERKGHFIAVYTALTAEKNGTTV